MAPGLLARSPGSPPAPSLLPIPLSWPRRAELRRENRAGQRRRRRRIPGSVGSGSRQTALSRVSPVGLLRPMPECACVSFPVSTLISVSSAPRRSQGELELLTPCVPPDCGPHGEGAAGRLAYTGAISLVWQVIVWRNLTGSKELAQTRQDLLGRAGREAHGGSLMFKPVPRPHSNPTCPARGGEGLNGRAGGGFWRGSGGPGGTGLNAAYPLARERLQLQRRGPALAPRTRLWLPLPPLARPRWGVND